MTDRRQTLSHSTNRPRRFLLLGGTTHANRGDRGMQAGLAQWLEREHPGAEVRFLASNPTETTAALGVKSLFSPDASLAKPSTRETRVSTEPREEARHRGKKFVRQARLQKRLPWWPAPPAVKEYAAHLRWADAVFVPGSGSMNSLWWDEWLYPKAFTVLAASAWGKPVFMTSQGVGPAFSHPLDADTARQMFNACALVGVRDGGASAAILRDIGVANEKICLTGDDALLFRSTCPGIPTPRAKFLLGVNLRDSSSYGKGYPKPGIEAVAAALIQVLEQHPDVNLVFIPISYDAWDDDRIPAQAVAEAIGAPGRIHLIREEYDAAQLRSLIARMDVCVGISYHFLMFALSAGVPAAGLFQNSYYRQKVEGLFDLYDLPQYALNFSGEAAAKNCTTLLEALGNLLDRKDELRECLRARQESIDLDCQQSRQRLLSGLESLP